jgi:cytochrome c oxidase subunit 2
VNANTQVGPDLTHFASRQTIGAGVLENNAADVRRWLTDPQRIKPGCYMPDFHLTGSNVEDLAAFFETLK